MIESPSRNSSASTAGRSRKTKTTSAKPPELPRARGAPRTPSQRRSLGRLLQRTVTPWARKESTNAPVHRVRDMLLPKNSTRRTGPRREGVRPGVIDGCTTSPHAARGVAPKEGATASPWLDRSGCEGPMILAVTMAPDQAVDARQGTNPADASCTSTSIRPSLHARGTYSAVPPPRHHQFWKNAGNSGGRPSDR